jgi:drug/metabolite transporter (DMT)-like permease
MSGQISAEKQAGLKTPQKVSPLLAGSALIFSTFVWGVMWWPVQWFSHHGLAGPEICLIAYGSVAAVGLPVLWRQRRAWLPNIGALLLIAAFGGWTNASFISAMTSDKIVQAMLLFYLAPLWSVLGAWIFLGEKPGLSRWAALALALVGVFVLLGGAQIFTDAAAMPFNAPGRAEWLALTSGIAFAGMNLTTRYAQHTPLASKIFVVFVATAIMSAVTLAAGPASFVPLTIPLVLLLAVFGLGWMLIGSGTTQFGVSHLPGGTAAMLLLNELVVGVISAWLIGGQHLSLHEWSGAVLILVAGLLDALASFRSTPVIA